MATQVQVSSALTPLARNEAMLRHPFLGSLSDVSQKPGEEPSPLAPLNLEDRNKLENPGRLPPTPSATSRPRWTPKPFSRETSSDTFAAVKPPFPGLKPGSVTPKTPTFLQTVEDAAKGFAGTVPPLLDQKLVDSKSSRELVANMPFYLSPQANTVILFESRSPEKERPGDAGGPLKAQEGQLLPSLSERSSRRWPSLSTDPRPVSCSPHGPLERSVAGGPKDPASNAELQQRPSLATEIHSQTQGRPASSAVFLESWQEQMQPSPPEAASGLWGQKPRSLSTDVTDKFENRVLSSQKKPCLAESREKSLDAASVRLLETPGAKGEAMALSAAEPCGPRGKSATQPAEALGAKSKGSTSQSIAPLGQAVPEDLGPISAKDRKDRWEIQSQEKLQTGQYNANKREWAELTPKEAGLRNASPPDPLEDKSRGSIKKTLTLLDTSADHRTATEAESVPGSPGKENRILNIQQRIKELTAENIDFKPENLRRSFRSRPLSADLTKAFSGPVTASDAKPKRQLEWNRKSVGGIPDVQADKTLPMGATDFRESPWKLLAKTPSTEGLPEGEGSFAKDGQNASLPRERPKLVLGPKAKTFCSFPSEDACLKTVRATMFEHHVQRHNVVADQRGAEPSLLSVMGSSGESLSRRRELWKERAQEGGLQTSKSFPWEADASGDAGKPKDPRPLTEDRGSLAAVWAEGTVKEEGKEPASKCVEDSLLCQRVEPRYEILQTVGERAQSEAVAAVPEGKAVTLRRERSLKESHPRASGAADGWRGALQPRGLGASPRNVLPAASSQRAFHREGSGLDGSPAGQQLPSEEAAPLTSRTKDGSSAAPCLETEKEKKLAPAGVMEESKALERFSGSRAGPGVPEADGCQGRAGALDQKTAPSLAGGCQSQAPLPGTSRWQRVSCAGLSSVGLKPTGPLEGPRGLTVRSARGGAEEESDGLLGGRQLQPLGMDVGWSSSSHSASAPKVSDRWRRKTLPHGTARFEDVSEPSLGAMELAGRRDTLHLLDCSIAKKSPQTLCGIDPRQAEAVSPDSLGKQFSPSEPKATYFAVTCQISEEINSEPGEDAAVAPRVGSPRRADPSDCQPRERLSEAPASRRGERAPSHDPEKGASEDPPTQARQEGQGVLQRRSEEAGGRPVGADPSFGPAARPLSCLLPLQRDVQLVLPKRPGVSGLGRAEEKAADRYRSRVVDIDELMAEYRGQSHKACGMEDQKESSLFPWEKLPSRRNFMGNVSRGSDKREMARVGHSLGGGRPGSDASHCGDGCERGSDPLEVHPQESSPWRARDGKRSPPPWGRLDVEKAKHWSAEPLSPRTKTTFLVDQAQGGVIGQGPQDTKDASPGSHPAGLDLGASWKEVSPKQWAALTPAGDRRPSSDWAGKTERKADTHTRVWEKDSPAAPAGAEQGGPASRGTGATPDLWGASSEKARQGQARPGLPSGPRLDQHRVCRSFPPERPGAQLSPSPRDCLSHQGERDLEQESPKEDHSDAGTRHPPYLPTQRRSHSFYNERRTDHWAGDHVKQCFGRPAAEARDTEVLVQEADSRYGTWRHSRESFVPESPSSESSAGPAQRPSPSSRASPFSSRPDPASAADRRGSSKKQGSTSLDDSSPEADSADGSSTPLPAGACQDFSFLEQTPRLDSRLLRSRVLLGKRRQQHRAPISRAHRQSGGGKAGQPPTPGMDSNTWMFQDSTEEKPTVRGESEEEEKPPPAERPPSSQPRLSLFSGLDPSALKAQLRKRHESEGREGAAPAPLCKSPKGSLQAGVSGGRALKDASGKEGRSEELLPPQWLKELKSKRKPGQPESPI